MVSCFISRIVILVFGTLYPAYASYKAVRTKNVKEYVKWMMYWIVFALFTCAETFTDLFLSFWFPFYYEIKIITVIYLLSPATKGSSILYRKFVHPALIKKEQEIDEYIAKAKEQGYHTMLNLGSKGVTLATSLLMQTALKGGGGIVNQLRRSYSLGDLSEEQNLRQIKEEADDTDSPYDEDPRLIRRKLVQSPRRTISSTDQTGLYFPEVEICPRPEDEMNYRQIPSYEEMSSGYSSGDPFYSNIQRPKGEQLIRTASLGPSSRIRTRAATKNGSFKRSGLSEGGSSWSALDSHESQNETDITFNIPLSHSASFPLPIPTLQHLVMPEYQYMLRNMPQSQIFTFINHSQFSQFLNGKAEDKTQEHLKTADCSSSEVIISEENVDNSNEEVTQKDDSSKSDDPVINSAENNDKENVAVVEDDNKIENKIAEKNSDVTLKNEVENKNSEAVTNQIDNFESKEKSTQERSGKYKKKPAPSPPAEDFKTSTNLTVEEEEEAAEFFTPNPSPKPSRKNSSSPSDLEMEKTTSGCEPNITKHDNNLLDVPKKSKTKTKKGEFNLQKKLHIPKMNFSFWHQKGGKQTSVSETSSVASVEISATSSDNKDDSEYFIPLKDVDDENDENKNIAKNETKCD